MNLLCVWLCFFLVFVWAQPIDAQEGQGIAGDIQFTDVSSRTGSIFNTMTEVTDVIS